MCWYCVLPKVKKVIFSVIITHNKVMFEESELVVSEQLGHEGVRCIFLFCCQVKPCKPPFSWNWHYN